MTGDLSWRSHVMSVSRRVHFSLHKLKFHRNTLSRELRTTLIVSLMFPLIDYCCRVFNDLTNEMNTKIQQLINCGIRFIFYLRRDVHISPYRRSLGWLSVKSRRFCVQVVLPSTLFKARLPPICLKFLVVMFLPSVPRINLFPIRSSHLLVVHQPIKTPSTRLQFMFGILFLRRLSPHPRLEFLSQFYMTICWLSRTSNPS